MTMCVAPVLVRHLRLTHRFRCPCELVVASNARVRLRAFAGGDRSEPCGPHAAERGRGAAAGSTSLW